MINIAANPPRVERVDDLPVIYGLLERMGMGAIIDDVVKAHGNWQGLSPGQVLTVWLMHSISEQNHKLEPVQQWAGGRRYLLESLLGSAVSEFDFTEERLAMGLRDLSQTSAWAALEERLGQRLLGIYDLPNETLRLDATVGSVYHAAEQGTLLAVGKAKKGHYAKQFKVMMASLAPLGLPVVVDVERGNQADDPLYVPSYQRAKTLLQRDGLLVVGDSKMSARTTRGTIATSHDYDLVRLADKKDEPALLSQLLEEWRSEESPSLPIFLPEDWPSDGSTPDPALAIASAVEVTRQQEAVVAGARVTWAERLLVVRADSYLQRSLASLHGRLEQAECALLALTPPRQRGKGQMQSKSALCAAIARLEQHYDVQGFFVDDYQPEFTERTICAYKGKPARVERRVRYQGAVQRKRAALTDAEAALGWRI